jgi:hypothetical protein
LNLPPASLVLFPVSLVALVGERLGVWDDIDRLVRLKKRRRGHRPSEAVMDMTLLMASGGECLDDLEMLRTDGALRKLIGRDKLLAPTTAGLQPTVRVLGRGEPYAFGHVPSGKCELLYSPYSGRFQFQRKKRHLFRADRETFFCNPLGIPNSGFR